jgi:phosphatidylethanolamine/phosphatidyl-N-methylethanolamine N-methyltransferase
MARVHEGSNTNRVLPASDGAITNAFIEGVYAKLSPIYDLLFGRVLQAGRIAAIARMGSEVDTRVLEVGIGTGINAPLYPRGFRVTGIDLSSLMLEKARERIARQGLHHIRLHEMDAANLAIDDDSFDIVYAPYLISVVPEPVQVAREMRRVCRPGGRILLLNHFRSSNPIGAWFERAISPLTIRVGFRSDLDLSTLLAKARLKASSIDQVNFPPIWSLVSCIKD